MIERFLDELRRAVTGSEATHPPELNKKLNSRSYSEESLLAVIPTVKKIVWRKLYSVQHTDAPDVVQKVILQLLTWRENQPGKSEQMTENEWQAFASKTTYHAVNRHLSNNKYLIEPLEAVAEISGENHIFGNTETEVASLLRVFWQEICELSLRQRRALLLNSELLIVILKQNGVGNQKLCEILELNEGDFSEIFVRLPLPDAQIALLTAIRGNKENQSIASLTKSIKKARYEARARLKKLISE
ncbi:MAG: hypothetical protein H0W58_06655 [Acidobacteria bacterium]|jgi:DNA-directed RNA polymerase specialized sigma24 family protein|nr:hypothetical protein [Acidobacteriota bacterium]